MRKTYEYLQNVYSPDLNIESKKRYFLSEIDNFVNQRQYVKMTLLDWEENPLKDIEGVISSGSISKDGSSSIRRTCNLSCSVDGESYNVDDMEMDFTPNHKIFIEIGIKNDSQYYQNYPILWFPQGVFFITSFSMNSSSSSVVNISLGLKDKMAMLNGDMGGTLPSTIRFDTEWTQVTSGEEKEQKVLIYNIINELVHHWGGEDLNNIIIEDVPLRIRAIMKWNGENSLYGEVTTSANINNNTPEQWTFSLDKKNLKDPYEFKYGDDVGYVYEDFVVTKELYGNPGDSVCTILDQIKNILGNYEYFYDEMGIFHFREIKNFLNVTQGEFVLDEMSENDYLIETTNEKAVYAFEDNRNITSITVTPQYDNIKNEYIVHGMRKGDDKNDAALIMYHLVIDKKPEIVRPKDEFVHWDAYHYYKRVICYTDPSDGLNKLAIPEEIDVLPTVGNMNKIYYEEKSKKYYYWDNVVYKEVVFINEKGKSIVITKDPKNPYYYPYYFPKDWRTFLYLKGLAAQNSGIDEDPYFEELAAFWPREYDLRHAHQDWFVHRTGKKEKSYSVLSQGNYFLDFIDTNSELGKYSVSAIGRRKDVSQNEDVNCLFEPEIPNVIFLNIDYPTDNVSENTTLYDDNEDKKKTDAQLLKDARDECNENGHPWTQVHNDIYSHLAIGGYANSAYEKIRYELFCHTNFQKTVSLTSIPVFYLEPNSRVTINDISTNTYGDFMVQNINLTLGPGANMAVTLNEIHERL